MVSRTRFASFSPLTVLALAAALAAPACGGGSSSSSDGGSGGSGASGGNTSSGGSGGSGGGSGCKTDEDCTSDLTCDVATGKCVGCSSDTQCEAGFVCNEIGQCVAGCNASQPCSGGLACCDGACTDLQNNPQACGACGTPCPKIPHAEEACVGGLCQAGACEMGMTGNYADCNLDASDGCEWDLDIFGPCTCEPGSTMECYTGLAGTKGVGTCVPGLTQCQPDGANWGPCMGEVTPVAEVCQDGNDNDCNGAADDAMDLDGDGWTSCDNDCCDVMLADGCGDPGLVNPGAFEVDGNMVDDDCDGMVDNPLSACDSGLLSNSGTATDYAKAIDLCATTVENPALIKDKKWGVISANLFLANGQGSAAANSRSIRPGFGTNIVPLGGSSLAVLSTGHAADANDTNPNFATFQNDGLGGQNMNTSSAVPSDWLQANNNNFPNAPGCPEPAGTTANDPVMLRIRVRVPTNAKSFAVSSFFFSSEYPEWTCSPYNDFFLALLDSSFVPGAGQVANPTDKNLAFYTSGNNKYPVGVNLAHNGTGLFNQCENGATGCMFSAIAGNTGASCTGTNLLTGTGFDQDGGNTYVCGNNDFVGGGTGWLTTNGNVAPGETIELRFVIWDTSDHIFDSLVLVDNFQWQLDASTPGTHE